MKLTRIDYQQQEDGLLAAFAFKSSESRGRQYPEKEHEFRTPFQRDRDRIIHSTAFRRLQYKTQVFVNHEGDHYRTRLTHTLEVCQIARSIARALKLNEDLVEAIALAHDLGHGPFGHAGEWALQELMKGYGGFEHNSQCLRIIEKLEDSYPDFPGLNLTFETRAGLNKHPEPLAVGIKPRKHFRLLEGELVDLADEIAYASHDLDDGLRSGILTESQIEKLALWSESLTYVNRRYPKIENSQRKRLVIRLIINRLVKDVIENVQIQIKRNRILSIADLQKNDSPLVVFSKTIKKKQQQLKEFLHQNLYQHYRVIRMTDKGKRFLKALFEGHVRNPEQLPPDVLQRSKKDGLQRAICDYLAGMTDRFATDEYRRLFEPYERV